MSQKRVLFFFKSPAAGLTPHFLTRFWRVLAVRAYRGHKTGYQKRLDGRKKQIIRAPQVYQHAKATVLLVLERYMRRGGLTLAAGRVHSKKKKKKKTRNLTSPETHHEIHSSPATQTTSRRRATKHVPCVSPYSPAPIDHGFVEIGLSCSSRNQ